MWVQEENFGSMVEQGQGFLDEMLAALTLLFYKLTDFFFIRNAYFN